MIKKIAPKKTLILKRVFSRVISNALHKLNKKTCGVSVEQTVI